jgi:hypothetical protein
MSKCSILLILVLSVIICESSLFLPGVKNYFSCEIKYTPKIGETCEYIAQKYKISMKLLKWRNKKVNCNSNLISNIRLCLDKWI